MAESLWSKGPGAWAMFCEKAMELVRELHRAAEGRLPAFNVRAGSSPGLFSGCTTRSGMAGVPVVPLHGCGKVVGRSVLVASRERRGCRHSPRAPDPRPGLPPPPPASS